LRRSRSDRLETSAAIAAVFGTLGSLVGFVGSDDGPAGGRLLLSRGGQLPTVVEERSDLRRWLRRSRSDRAAVEEVATVSKPPQRSQRSSAGSAPLSGSSAATTVRRLVA
jgi:hypothetical protein